MSPSPSSGSDPRRREVGIAALANAGSVLAFFLLPYAHLFGTDITAPEWIARLSRVDAGVAVVWIVPLCTAAACTLGFMACVAGRRATRRLTAIAALAVTTLVALCYALNMLVLEKVGLGALRAGFWVGGGLVLVALVALASAVLFPADDEPGIRTLPRPRRRDSSSSDDVLRRSAS